MKNLSGVCMFVLKTFLKWLFLFLTLLLKQIFQHILSNMLRMFFNTVKVFMLQKSPTHSI